MTIVSIRGTHGAGKTTVVKDIIKKYHAEAILDSKLRPVAYVVELKGLSVYVPGSYEIACGGCDSIQPYSQIIPHLEHGLAECGNVLFEGALVSSSYGSVGKFMEACENPIFAFLDTPIEVCLERIAARRLAKWGDKPGAPPPVNPDNTVHKFDSVAGTKTQMKKLNSEIRIVDINYKDPVKQILRLFK